MRSSGETLTKYDSGTGFDGSSQLNVTEFVPAAAFTFVAVCAHIPVTRVVDADDDALGVAEAEPVGVGVALEVGVPEALGDTAGVALELGELATDEVGVTEDEGVADALGVGSIEPTRELSVLVGEGEAVASGEDVTVAVGAGVEDTDGAALLELEALDVALADALGDTVGLTEDVAVGLTEGRTELEVHRSGTLDTVVITPPTSTAAITGTVAKIDKSKPLVTEIATRAERREPRR